MVDQPLETILFCARCAAELRPGDETFYHVRIVAISDPSPPQIDTDESPAAVRARIERLLEQMSDLSAQEAMDQVQRRLTLHLCLRCYQVWIENPAGGE